ncbi:uncharacterized protein LOC126998144 [Eriocheir sinensis]|uniref:uncharacterized protein LOC126998144 n=1 Tax=Eriocheir sinensis TaxID=95602 RepID=UPI0021C9B069|nr:uncharacterized protein LOC126998144 [Eriocheir sinensis]
MVMAVKAFADRIFMVVLIACCAVNTSTTGPVNPVAGKSRLPRTSTPEDATSPTPTPSPDQDSPDTTITDSSDLLSNEVHYSVSQSGAVNPRDGNSETRHEMQEEKEGSLLEDDTANDMTETVSEELVTTELPDDGETSMVQNATRSSIGALYTLYSLISYVAMAREENIPETKSKEVVSAHINSLYVLYSLVSYVVHSDASYEPTNEANDDNTTQTFTAANRFSAQHQEMGEESAEGSEKPNTWTRYLIIAASVVGAVALIIIAAICLITHCRRARIYPLDKRVVVCQTCSPSI